MLCEGEKGNFQFVQNFESQSVFGSHRREEEKILAAKKNP